MIELFLTIIGIFVVMPIVLSVIAVYLENFIKEVSK